MLRLEIRPDPNARADLEVRRATVDDHAALTALLSTTSQEALALRFLTGMGGTPPPRLVSRLLMSDALGGAHLAVRGRQVVGHAMWAPLPGGARDTAEIAILVRDDHQRRGVGAALLDALVADLRAAEVRWVQVTIAARNRVVAAMVGRRRPGARARPEGSELTYLLALDGPSDRRGSVRLAP